MSADDTPTWDGIIADYERAVESGDPPDREELVGQHFDLADNTAFPAGLIPEPKNDRGPGQSPPCS